MLLITGRERPQDGEPRHRDPLAAKAGISKKIADAIGRRRRLVGLCVDQDMAHNHTTELVKNKRVFDTTFERIKARYETKGGVDLTGIAGHGLFLVMPLNSVQHKTPRDQVGLNRPDCRTTHKRTFHPGMNALTAVRIPMAANAMEPHKSHRRLVSTVMAASAMAI